jgi:hypothetical protein
MEVHKGAELPLRYSFAVQFVSAAAANTYEPVINLANGERCVNRGWLYSATACGLKCQYRPDFSDQIGERMKNKFLLCVDFAQE